MSDDSETPVVLSEVAFEAVLVRHDFDDGSFEYVGARVLVDGEDLTAPPRGRVNAAALRDELLAGIGAGSVIVVGRCVCLSEGCDDTLIRSEYGDEKVIWSDPQDRPFYPVMTFDRVAYERAVAAFVKEVDRVS